MDMTNMTVSDLGTAVLLLIVNERNRQGEEEENGSTLFLGRV